MESIEVSTKVTQNVDVPIAIRLCSQFADWMDMQGWRISPVIQTDERSYEDMATSFVNRLRANEQ